MPQNQTDKQLRKLCQSLENEFCWVRMGLGVRNVFITQAPLGLKTHSRGITWYVVVSKNIKIHPQKGCLITSLKMSKPNKQTNKI